MAIRGASLYTWENEAVAMRLWRPSGKRHLYKLEIEELNVRRRGDLNWYSEAVDAVKAGRSIEAAVEKYCSGIEAGAPYTEPRIEVLVSEAKVVKKLSATEAR